MKRPNNNNKYRNNNNNGYNPNYSLNYKFDSNSPAGKISGTALELIKRYNDLAKDAFSNNDYITAEVYRQFAEHYRKIVTDINERRNNGQNQNQNNNRNKDNTHTEEASTAVENTTTEDKADEVVADEPVAQPSEKKEFKVIEISEAKETAKPKRTYRRKVAAE
ncbi:MAG: DUF4167 domain-containing protein [Lactobacillus sp.]|nr:DUF4167 domain-containing protein [Lactobacillus sp.]